MSLAPLKNVYGGKAKVSNGYGGSPKSVLDKAVNKFSKDTHKYDKRTLVIDGDVPITASFKARCKRERYDLIIIHQICIECFLLDLLHMSNNGATVCSGCKSILKSHMNYSNTADFEKKLPRFFPKTLLDVEKQSNKILDDLIKACM